MIAVFLSGFCERGTGGLALDVTNLYRGLSQPFGTAGTKLCRGAETAA